MNRRLRFQFIVLLLLGIFLTNSQGAAAKVHVIAWGKWMTVQWSGGGAEGKSAAMKIRPLVIDGRVKEYVLGAPHEVTDRVFVVRRVFRVNDSLPEDSAPHWEWQRGGWMLVDRVTGHVSALSLPEFDAFYSAASWYRDYVAYCGVADDGKTFAIVAQLSRRKPVLKKGLPEGVPQDAAADSACPVPIWQRGPTRVSFEATGTKQTFAIRGHVVDVVNDTEEEEGN